MRACMHLSRLHDATQYRIKRLLDLYQSSSPLPQSQQSRRLAYIAIELDNMNINVLREFTVSTIRRAKTISGARISVNRNLGPDGEIGAYILSVLNQVRFSNMKSPATIKRTDEPTVRDPNEIRKILIDCSASNLPSLDNALSLNSRLFRDVKTIRHFYAHRSKDTFIKVSTTSASMGLYHPKHPDQILSHVMPGRSMPVIEEWLIEAQIFYELLMQ